MVIDMVFYPIILIIIYIRREEVKDYGRKIH